MITEKAKAKVNLTLQVRGKRDDGYHLLESLVVFPDIADVLCFEPSGDLDLEVSGPGASALSGVDPQSNLVMKAARALKDEFGVREGARISLEKNLPAAAGIGGGSADAAASLRGLSQLWALQPEEAQLQEIALRLGADVPVCLASEPAVMSGIGEVLLSVEQLPPFFLVLANCGQPVSTASVFQALDLGACGASSQITETKWESFQQLVQFLCGQGNDLEAKAMHLEPEIKICLDTLKHSEGAALARMSGSGATCFALFDEECLAGKAAAMISKEYPEWWVEAAPV